MESIRIVKCIVAGNNSRGEPDLYFVKVHCNDSDYEDGKHYELAEESAKENGYDAKLTYDEFDSAGSAMLGLFEWDSATVKSY